ncbi:MAG: hypothetical protein AAB784_02090, partial [Patescibacteria group bacterium]
MISKRGFTGEGRINLFIIALFVLTSLIVYRLFSLTQIQHESFVDSARDQYNNPSALLTGRGNIYFSDYSLGSKKMAATNRLSYYVFSNNTKINSSLATESLGSILNLDSEQLKTLFNQTDKKYLVIARNLTKERADSVKALKLSGVTVASEINRFYANGDLAAATIGFVGFEGNKRGGQYGVEFFYDDVLSGANRTLSFLGNKTYSDLFKNLKFWKKKNNDIKNELDDVREGGDIVLTIDSNIQSMVEIKLAELLKKWQATGGSVIVQDPSSGAILAMASLPSFNPNSYSKHALSDFINPNIQE